MLHVSFHVCFGLAWDDRCDMRKTALQREQRKLFFGYRPT